MSTYHCLWNSYEEDSSKSVGKSEATRSAGPAMLHFFICERSRSVEFQDGFPLFTKQVQHDNHFVSNGLGVGNDDKGARILWVSLKNLKIELDFQKR